MNELIKTQNGTIGIITTDNYTGEGTEDLRLEIENKVTFECSHIDLDIFEAIHLRDILNEWIDD